MAAPGPTAAGPGPGPGSGPAGPQGPASAAVTAISPAQTLSSINSEAWLQLGALAESMGEYDRAMASYEAALRHSYHPVTALNQIAELYRSRENFPKVWIRNHEDKFCGRQEFSCVFLRSSFVGRRVLSTHPGDREFQWRSLGVAWSLLSHDGRTSKGLQRVSKCTSPPAQPQGTGRRTKDYITVDRQRY